MGEYGAGLKLKDVPFLVINGNTNDIRGEEVAGKLDSLEGAVYGPGKSMGEGCLANPRDVFYEQMPSCNEGCYCLLDNLRFSFDYLFQVPL